MQNLILEGESYILKMQAAPSHYTWTGGTSESGDSFCSTTCWEGQAQLSSPRGELIFNFTTRKHREISIDGLAPLEEEVLVVSGISKKATIVEKKKIVEALCGKLWDAVFNEQTKGILFIVTIQLPVIDGVPFMNQGYIVEPGHQMEILT